MSSWNVDATVTVEELTDDDFPDTFPRGITTLDIDFNSQGYYQAASMYGGSDNLGWPAEGDDERTMIGVRASDDDGNKIPLTVQQQQELFDQHFKRVEDEELPYDDSYNED